MGRRSRIRRQGWQLIQGDSLEVLKDFPDCHFDSMVTDPPAGIAFMGLEFDKDKGGRDQWIAWLSNVLQECYRVLKPGAHILVWALPRTSGWTHRSIEDAGFQVRDIITHIFGTGFPKSLSLPNGGGTALKPGAEFWILARKPCAYTVAKNVQHYGTGGLNIDSCRIPSGADHLAKCESVVGCDSNRSGDCYSSWEGARENSYHESGRWPANLALSHSDQCTLVHRQETRATPKASFSFKTGEPTQGYEVVADQEEVLCVEGCPVKQLDDQSGFQVSGVAVQRNRDGGVHNQIYGAYKKPPGKDVTYADSGGVSRFFYCAKPDRTERDLGCEQLPMRSGGELTNRKAGSAGLNNPRAGAGRSSGGKNVHPCVHPTTRVMTDRGYRKIETIETGDRVLGANGIFNEVIDISRHPYTSQDLFKIFVSGTNGAVRATDNHPFLIWRPIHKKRSIVGGHLSWIHAEDLQIGDYTLTPILSEPHPPHPLDNRGPVFWFIIGLYAAEGYMSGGSYPAFALHQNEGHLVDRLRSYTANLGIYPRSDSACTVVVVFDRQLGHLCKKLAGRLAHKKRFCPVVWKLSRDNRQALVDGYLAGDGGQVRTWQQAKSVSEDLASQITFLAESVGYQSAFYRYPATGGHIGNREFKSTRPYFLSRFSNRNNQHTEYNGGRKPSRPTLIEYEGTLCSLRRIKDIKKVEYLGQPVVNLTVKNSPTFQTLVGLTHNTVKPLKLMRWMTRLVSPLGGLVLDPFAGSGSTGAAALAEGFRFVGIEQDPQYAEIAVARLSFVAAHPEKVPVP